MPEDLDELVCVGCLLGMLFASGCGASTGEASTVVQVRREEGGDYEDCAINLCLHLKYIYKLPQSRHDTRAAPKAISPWHGLASRWPMRASIFAWCSLLALPTHNKYLVIPTYSQATHTQVLGALGVPILPLPPYTPTMQGQQHRPTNVTSPPSFFAEAVATDPGYIPI